MGVAVVKQGEFVALGGGGEGDAQRVAIWVLTESVRSILGDDSAPEKAPLLRKSMEEFILAVVVQHHA